jgi:hypothetical protein
VSRATLWCRRSSPATSARPRKSLRRSLEKEVVAPRLSYTFAAGGPVRQARTVVSRWEVHCAAGGPLRRPEAVLPQVLGACCSSSLRPGRCLSSIRRAAASSLSSLKTYTNSISDHGMLSREGTASEVDHAMHRRQPHIGSFCRAFFTHGRERKKKRRKLFAAVRESSKRAVF